MAVTYASVRVPWKWIGLAGLAGVAATGVVVARRRRVHREINPKELRARLHRRLAEARQARQTPQPADFGGAES